MTRSFWLPLERLAIPLPQIFSCKARPPSEFRHGSKPKPFNAEFAEYEEDQSVLRVLRVLRVKRFGPGLAKRMLALHFRLRTVS